MRWNPHDTPRAPTTDDYLERLRPQLLIEVEPPGENDLVLNFYMANEDEVNPDWDLQMMLRDNVDPSMSGMTWDEEMLEFQRDKIENYDPNISTIPDFNVEYALSRIARFLTERIFTDSNGDEVIEVDPNDLRDFVAMEWGFVVTDNDSIPEDHLAHPSQGLSIYEFVDRMNGGALLGEERWDLVFYAMELAINGYVRDHANSTPIENRDARFRFKLPYLTEPVRGSLINRSSVQMPHIAMISTEVSDGYPYFHNDFLEDINERVMDLFGRRGLFPAEIPVYLTYTLG